MTGCVEDGGPAFPKPLDPYPNAQGMESGTHGMSLRDWFAGQALAGWVPVTVAADKAQLAAAAALEGYAGDVDGYLALRAYKTADAMLRARSGASS